jgi:hypothetical protein
MFRYLIDLPTDAVTNKVVAAGVTQRLTAYRDLTGYESPYGLVPYAVWRVIAYD